jgi:hypothetical protein
MSRFLYACSLACPLVRLFVPRQRSGSHVDGWLEDEDVDIECIAVEMKNLEQFGRSNEVSGVLPLN